jgi:hypothetical protein
MTNKCVKKLVGFINPDLPQHVSARDCHLQGVAGAVEATQVISVLWAYDPSTPTIQILLESLLRHLRPLKMATTCRNMLG